MRCYWKNRDRDRDRDWRTEGAEDRCDRKWESIEHLLYGVIEENKWHKMLLDESREGLNKMNELLRTRG